jgi:ornithine cyclodeaminase
MLNADAVAAVLQPDDITVFDLTGLALQDLTVARLIHEKARDGGLGIAVHWPWIDPTCLR